MSYGLDINSFDSYNDDSNRIFNLTAFRHLSLQNSIYLPGKTNIQLEAWDRETVTDGSSNSYEVVIDTTNGCSAEEPLSVTL